MESNPRMCKEYCSAQGMLRKLEVLQLEDSMIVIIDRNVDDVETK